MPGLNAIGERVRKLRESRDLTQDQVAAACQRRGWDISRVSLTKIETGTRRVADGEVIVLAAALKCTPGELLNGIKMAEAMKVVRQGRSAQG